MSLPLAFIFLLFLVILKLLFYKKITSGIWSIKVFNSQSLISIPPSQDNFENPTLKASDITDVPAEFIADPFIIMHGSFYYLFFEILDKSSGKGIIGMASSGNGENWAYERVVLKEDYHLSYPYVFKNNEDFFMIPESSEANRVLLYKAKNFPYEWEIAAELIEGKYTDCSIFQYNYKWWMFAGKGGKLHLFFSEKLQGKWMEHPKSPLITNNYNITRPGGRVIVDNNKIYRYAQDGEPTYGSAVRAFFIKQLSEKEYEEEEMGLILSGTKIDRDWREDGMHTIDQLKISEKNWLIAVDGHMLDNKNYFLWKLDRILAKVIVSIKFYFEKSENSK